MPSASSLTSTVKLMQSLTILNIGLLTACSTRDQEGTDKPQPSSSSVAPANPTRPVQAAPEKAAVSASSAEAATIFNALRFGVLADYRYPAQGTDNAAALQACFNAAGQAGDAYAGRARVQIPPGMYLFNSPLTLPSNVDLDMRGAQLHYRGQNKKTAILTLGNPERACADGTYEGIYVTGSFLPPTFDEEQEEHFACVKITWMHNCQVEFQRLAGASIGLLLAPSPGKAIAYCRFHGLNAQVVKTGLEIRGTYNTGWCNENDFYGSNFTLTSSAAPLGALTGVKFSVDQQLVSFDPDSDIFTRPNHGLRDQDRVYLYAASGYASLPAGFDTTTSYYVLHRSADSFQLSSSNDGPAVDGKTPSTGPLYAIGYPGQNNNRFFGTCFQVGNHSKEFELTLGRAVKPGIRYVNMANQSEYYCAEGGEVATVPTHTAGLARDAAGVAFEYVGHYARSPVWFDRAGAMNIFYGARWEGGWGPFCRISHRPSASIAIANNEMHVYAMDVNPQAVPVFDYFTGASVNTGYHENKFRLYGRGEPTSTIMSDIHKRAIGSEGNLCVQGMYFKGYGEDSWKPYERGSFVLCRDAVYCQQDSTLGVLIDLHDYSACAFGFRNAGVDQGRMWVNFINEDYQTLKANGVNDMSVGLVGGGVDQFFSQTGGWASGSNRAFSGVARKHPTSNARYLFVGFSHNGAELSQVFARPIPGGPEGIDGQLPLRFCTPYEADSNRGGRFAYGTPNVGYFETVGECITNINTEKGQPQGWIVRSAGILAPAWLPGVTVRRGELRLHAGRVYAAGSAGSTAAPGLPPVHAMGRESDGNLEWEYAGRQAVLSPLPRNY